MCGRYSLSSPAQLVQETFAAECGQALEQPGLAPRWNIAPTQEALVVRRPPQGNRRLDLLRWGLVPGRSERTAGHINARAETAGALPAFRKSFHARRCLVPADGFYEWRREGRARQPYHIRFRDRRLFAMAGLWSAWNEPGSEEAGSFTILTCPPVAVVGALHDRMPVILPPESWEAWLSPNDDADAAAALLLPWPGEELEVVAVDPWVNKADHEGARCVEEVAYTPASRQLSLL